jgi:pyrroloquinoline quinone biosynthesis protein E
VGLARLCRCQAQALHGRLGAVFLVVAPDGVALPCHSARMLPGLDFPNLRDTPVREAWVESAAFNAYRGQGWMDPTCAGCDDRHTDLAAAAARPSW